MAANSIPDEHHIARYCRPRQTEQGLPSVRAFHLRPIDQGHLSVNWMEYFTPNHNVVTTSDRTSVIAQIRQHIQMDLSSEGRFAVLNMGMAKEAIVAGGGQSPNVRSDPQPARPAQGNRPARGPDPSHALVSGYTADDNLDVAVKLLALVGPDDVFPGAI